MPFTLALERWSDGLAIGLLARTLAAHQQVGSRASQERLALEERLGELLSRIGDSDRKLLSLPLSSLRALTDDGLAGRIHGWQELQASARQSIQRLTMAPGPGIPAMTAAARLLAHLCLEGTCSVAFIARCAKAVLSKNWHWAVRDDSWKEQANKSLCLLRAQSTLESVDTASRTAALDALTQALPTTRPGWPLVENAIFHQLFAWPLLVDTQTPPRYDCHSLPVAIDVVFDGKSRVYVEIDEIGDHATLNVVWQRELKRSLLAAKRLWRSKHGGLPTEFRQHAMSASVVVDFRVAERVSSWAPFRLALFDDSMVPYFAQVMLHRLLGRGLGFSCAVIGRLGARRRQDEKPELDYVLLPAGGADRKLRYVLQSEEYASVVLSDQESPSVYDQVRNAAASDKTFTEINICPFLSNTADAVQPHGWRQHHYVRCPDILRLMHLAPDELLPAENAEVVEIGRLLSENLRSIVHLPERMGILAVMSYLHHINVHKRTSLTPTPPSLAWTVIRAVEGENDRKLWHTIWNTIGARHEDFRRFRHATNATDAAQHAADALNTFSPSEACLSHRAPDLLIVVNAEALVPEDYKEDAEEYRSHLFGSVIKHLAHTELRPSPIEELRPFIGHTRIVVMRAGGTEVLGTRSRSRAPIEPVHKAALQQLSTFRLGFTQQMAKVLLSELRVPGKGVRDMLDTLVQTGHANYAAGEYWISGNFGTNVTKTWSPAVQAQRHWAAAKAFAPYMAVTERALQVDLSAAFAPAAVHEALVHVEVARGIEVQRTGRLSFDDPAKRPLQAMSVFKGRLLRFVQLPSLGTVQDLIKDHYGLSSTAAWELSLEQLEEKAMLKIEPSPQEFATYANAGAAWLRDVKRKQNTDVKETKKEEILREVLNLYDLALEGSADSPGARSRRLSVLTHYGHFLERFGDRTESNQLDLASVREEVDTLVTAGVHSSTSQAKYFEIQGDRCEEPADAARWYRRMTTLSPKYATGWAKLAGTDLTTTLDEIRHGLLRAQVLDKVIDWAKARKPFVPDKSGLDTPVVRQRWAQGIAAILSMEVAQSKQGKSNA